MQSPQNSGKYITLEKVDEECTIDRKARQVDRVDKTNRKARKELGRKEEARKSAALMKI